MKEDSYLYTPQTTDLFDPSDHIYLSEDESILPLTAKKPKSPKKSQIKKKSKVIKLPRLPKNYVLRSSIYDFDDLSFLTPRQQILWLAKKDEGLNEVKKETVKNEYVNQIGDKKEEKTRESLSMNLDISDEIKDNSNDIKSDVNMVQKDNIENNIKYQEVNSEDKNIININENSAENLVIQNDVFHDNLVDDITIDNMSINPQDLVTASETKCDNLNNDLSSVISEKEPQTDFKDLIFEKNDHNINDRKITPELQKKEKKLTEKNEKVSKSENIVTEERINVFVNYLRKELKSQLNNHDCSLNNFIKIELEKIEKYKYYHNFHIIWFAAQFLMSIKLKKCCQK